jgi:hypothetical protein
MRHLRYMRVASRRQRSIYMGLERPSWSVWDSRTKQRGGLNVSSGTSGTSTSRQLLKQHAPHYESMLADAADRRPAARDLLDDFFPQPTHAPSLPNQGNGATVTYSAAPTPMGWTQTVATAIFQGVPQPAQRNESTEPLQPNPVAVQSPKAPPNRPAQQGVRRGGSVKSAKSTDKRQKKGHKRGGSSQNGRHALSQSGAVPKPSRNQRSRSKSILKAKEIRVLGIA